MAEGASASREGAFHTQSTSLSGAAERSAGRGTDRRTGVDRRSGIDRRAPDRPEIHFARGQEGDAQSARRT